MIRPFGDGVRHTRSELILLRRAHRKWRAVRFIVLSREVG